MKWRVGPKKGRKVGLSGLEMVRNEFLRVDFFGRFWSENAFGASSGGA